MASRLLWAPAAVAAAVAAAHGIRVERARTLSEADGAKTPGGAEKTAASRDDRGRTKENITCLSGHGEELPPDRFTVEAKTLHGAHLVSGAFTCIVELCAAIRARLDVQPGQEVRIFTWGV